MPNALGQAEVGPGLGDRPAHCALHSFLQVSARLRPPSAENPGGASPPPKTLRARATKAAAATVREAKEAFSSGELERSVELYTLAINAGPPTADLYADRALALVKHGDYHGASVLPSPTSLLRVKLNDLTVSVGKGQSELVRRSA